MSKRSDKPMEESILQVIEVGEVVEFHELAYKLGCAGISKDGEYFFGGDINELRASFWKLASHRVLELTVDRKIKRLL